MITSATRLEGWAVCPFAYLVRELLGVERGREPRGRAADLPARPGLARPRGPRAVRRRGRSAGPAGGAARPDDAVVGRRTAPPVARDRRARSATDYEAHGLVGRPIFWHRDRRRIIGRPGRFLELDSVHRADARHPAGGRRAGLRVSRAPARPRELAAPRRAQGRASGARPTGSTSPTTARSTSSTTRRAAPSATRTSARTTPTLGAAAAARRLRPGGPAASGERPTPRCGPSTGSPRAGAASSASATGDARGARPGGRHRRAGSWPASRPGCSPTTRPPRARRPSSSAPTATPTGWAWPSSAASGSASASIPALAAFVDLAEPLDESGVDGRRSDR